MEFARYIQQIKCEIVKIKSSFFRRRLWILLLWSGDCAFHGSKFFFSMLKNIFNFPWSMYRVIVLIECPFNGHIIFGEWQHNILENIVYVNILIFLFFNQNISQKPSKLVLNLCVYCIVNLIILYSALCRANIFLSLEKKNLSEFHNSIKCWKALLPTVFLAK